jgi:hypothetical protein
LCTHKPRKCLRLFVTARAVVKREAGNVT